MCERASVDRPGVIAANAAPSSFVVVVVVVIAVFVFADRRRRRRRRRRRHRRHSSTYVPGLGGWAACWLSLSSSAAACRSLARSPSSCVVFLLFSFVTRTGHFTAEARRNALATAGSPYVGRARLWCRIECGLVYEAGARHPCPAARGRCSVWVCVLVVPLARCDASWAPHPGSPALYYFMCCCCFCFLLLLLPSL